MWSFEIIRQTCQAANYSWLNFQAMLFAHIAALEIVQMG